LLTLTAFHCRVHDFSRLMHQIDTISRSNWWVSKHMGSVGPSWVAKCYAAKRV